MLKKQPDFQCCKALMALALLRLGRDTEAERALDVLLKEVPTDDAVLQAMNIALKELQRRECYHDQCCAPPAVECTYFFLRGPNELGRKLK